jgi:Rieske Fe-S protein
MGYVPGETAIETATRGDVMAVCEVCGNDYDKSFEVTAAGETHTFDSFECAIHRMAPVCEHCGCKVIGHGTEVDGHFYCCAHCARHATEADMSDRA